MISLFQSFNNLSKELYHTLKRSNQDIDFISIEDNGFLPDDVDSPYSFFINETQLQTEKPLFFNEVNIPRYWEIEGNNNVAHIRNMGELKGTIHYKKGLKNRIVQQVEWLDKKGNPIFIDYYNKFGHRFAQTVFDAQKKPIFRKYFNDKQIEVIYENLITRDIMLKWHEKEYIFHSKVDFIHFYLKKANYNIDSFIINSLSNPFLTIYRLKEPGVDYLFWQEKIKGELPANMRAFMERKSRDYRIVVPSEIEYEILHDYIGELEHSKIILSGYIYKFNKSTNYSNNILTLTNSDDLPHIIEIIQYHPDMNFHIAALTEMSSKLLQLDDYENVLLYPGASRETLLNLYKRCDIYLDINKGREVMDSVRAAFDFNLLILGYREVTHNSQVVHPENTVQIEQYRDLIKIINHIKNNPFNMEERRKKQKYHARAITVEQFNEIFS